MSHRDIEYSLESALGHVVLGKSTVSELSATLSEEYEAWRTRDLSKEPVTYLRRLVQNAVSQEVASGALLRNRDERREPLACGKADTRFDLAV